MDVDELPPEKQNNPGGAMNAMAMLGLLFYSNGHVTKKQFLDTSREAAAGCRIVGDRIGAAFLDAICRRLE